MVNLKGRKKERKKKEKTEDLLFIWNATNRSLPGQWAEPGYSAVRRSASLGRRTKRREDIVSIVGWVLALKKTPFPTK
jgi:hypothetical protein